MSTCIINGLTYRFSTRPGECGAIVGRTDLYFPFFLIGACGEDDCVLPVQDNRDRIVAPTQMDYKWFEKIATTLSENPFDDWDWKSFSANILEPNREHLKIALSITDQKVDRLINDGNVFLTHFEEDEEGEEEESYYPTFKNFLLYDNLEY